MATNRVSKSNLILESGIITIFNHKGYVTGGRWKTDDSDYPPKGRIARGEIVVFRINPVGEELPIKLLSSIPASHEIEEVIESDYNADNDDKISYIVVSPLIAVRLFCEGKITRRHVDLATTSKGEIVFEDVEFDTQNGENEYKIVVKKSPQYEIATYDEDDNLILPDYIDN